MNTSSRNIGAVLFSLAASAGCNASPKTELQKPYILYIMADDHTSQAWGIYGGQLKDFVHTPNIRRLAKEGCVLENCLVSNSICTPRRATILTGQYSHVNGVKTLNEGLSPEQNNIAKIMQNGGYQTSLIGKWHLKQEPAGFDYYCVLPGQGRYWDPIFKTKENWQDYREGGKSFPGERKDFMFYPDLPFSVDGLDDRDARMKTYQKLVKDFMRCGAAIDNNIGKLLDYLDKAGLAENTIVIYTADQGYFLGEHGFFDKRLIYEESIHMPFVIRYPKEIPAGTRNSDLVENVDFSALIVDYAGIKYPATMQGQSFRENLKGNTSKDWRKYGYYRYWQHEKDRPAHFGIRGERYKLVFYYGNGLKQNKYTAEEQPTSYLDFFDLQEDPHELHNAYNDPSYQEIIKKMKDEIMHQRTLLGDTDEDNPEINEIIANHWN